MGLESPNMAARLKALLGKMKSDNGLRMLAPAQNIRWTGKELASRIENLSAAFTAFDYKQSDRLVICGQAHAAENVVAQLAVAIAGGSVSTVKTSDAIAGQTSAAKGVFVGLDDAKYAAAPGLHPPIVCGELAARVPGALTFEAVSWDTPFPQGEPRVNADREPEFFYNSSTGVSLEKLFAQGEATQQQLGLTAEDSVCLPITMNHSMGMGFGVLAALLSEATIVLPGTAPEASSTMAALQELECTVLFADTHTYNTLPQEAVLPKLRTGVVKIGSGEAFGLAEPRMFAGVELHTIGKPK